MACLDCARECSIYGRPVEASTKKSRDTEPGIGGGLAAASRWDWTGSTMSEAEGHSFAMGELVWGGLETGDGIVCE